MGMRAAVRGFLLGNAASVKKIMKKALALILFFSSFGVAMGQSTSGRCADSGNSSISYEVDSDSVCYRIECPLVGDRPCRKSEKATGSTFSCERAVCGGLSEAAPRQCFDADQGIIRNLKTGERIGSGPVSIPLYTCVSRTNLTDDASCLGKLSVASFRSRQNLFAANSHMMLQANAYGSFLGKITQKVKNWYQGPYTFYGWGHRKLGEFSHAAGKIVAAQCMWNSNPANFGSKPAPCEYHYNSPDNIDCRLSSNNHCSRRVGSSNEECMAQGCDGMTTTPSGEKKIVLRSDVCMPPIPQPINACGRISDRAAAMYQGLLRQQMSAADAADDVNGEFKDACSGTEIPSPAVRDVRHCKWNPYSSTARGSCVYP